MTLKDLIVSVKEKNLSKEQLEGYADQLSALFAQMCLEVAELEKQEAMTMNDLIDDMSVAQKKIFWKATKEGQRLIELKRYLLATKELINSTKSRVFRLIY